MPMFTVYILKSLKKNWNYVGMTIDVSRRVREHNSGKEKSTRSYKPFKLVYKKDFETRAKARDYEKFLKIRSNKEKVLRNV